MHCSITVIIGQQNRWRGRRATPTNCVVACEPKVAQSHLNTGNEIIYSQCVGEVLQDTGISAVQAVGCGTLHGSYGQRTSCILQLPGNVASGECSAVGPVGGSSAPIAVV
jgi:hypothetical protein